MEVRNLNDEGRVTKGESFDFGFGILDFGLKEAKGRGNR